ncbi:helix-turn-helix domain-containing protein [Flavobacterium sp. TBRC 19031]|uniref:helix-turn-helix domain-containing protein n=1 Tax=Flavobacterium mekongense TaxID=3379707 RepID=UPI00399BCC9D
MDRKDQIKLDFGKNLTRLRNEKNLSIRALANSAGLEYSQVRRIENGQVNLALSTIIALAEGLNIEPAILLSFPGAKK